MRFLSWLLIIFLHTGLAPLQAQTIRDANAQLRQVSAFSSVQVGGAFDVIFTQGGSHAVAVSASDPAMLGQIVTEVEGGTLKIRFESKGMKWGRDHKLRAYVSAPTIDALSAGGASTVLIEGVLKTKDLRLEISGASDFRGNVDVENLRLSTSGASDVLVGGKATHARVNISGSSDIKAFDLNVDYADVNASGSSDVSITVQKEIKVEASGASDINYKGAGIVRQVSLSGSSDLKKKS